MGKTRPVHEIRLGRIKAAIWANEVEGRIRHNVTFSRLYKEGKDWKAADSFGRDDLPLIAKVADMVHTWIYQSAESSTANGGDDKS
jgi:hypothetical protein